MAFFDKLKAGVKVAAGAARAAGGVATGTGHGLLGHALKNHHHMANAVKFGTEGVQAGAKMIGEGIEDWKRADRGDEGEFA